MSYREERRRDDRGNKDPSKTLFVGGLSHRIDERVFFYIFNFI